MKVPTWLSLCNTAVCDIGVSLYLIIAGSIPHRCVNEIPRATSIHDFPEKEMENRCSHVIPGVIPKQQILRCYHPQGKLLLFTSKTSRVGCSHNHNSTRYSWKFKVLNHPLTHIIPSLVAAKHRFNRRKAKQSNRRRAFSHPLSCAKFTRWTLGQACFPEVKLHERPPGHTMGIPSHGALVLGLMRTHGTMFCPALTMPQVWNLEP